MPIYEYECLACGKTTEAIQKFSDALLDTCPECGGQLKKLISNTTFVLKGTGWYVTDYGRKGLETAKRSSETEKKSHGDKETKTTTDTTSEAKADSAKEAKTETKKEPAAAS